MRSTTKRIKRIVTAYKRIYLELCVTLCVRESSVTFLMHAGDDIESESHPGSDDASHRLASGRTDGRRLAVMFEAFKNMRISAYTAALMG
jgi:hypothetical protein